MFKTEERAPLLVEEAQEGAILRGEVPCRESHDVLPAVDAVLDEVREQFTATDQLGGGEEEGRGRVIQRALQQLRATGAFGVAARAEVQNEPDTARSSSHSDRLQTAVEITRRLARVDGSLAQIPQSHFVFSRYVGAGVRCGDESALAHGVLEGTVLVANAQVERDPVRIGTDVQGRQTLRGSKRFCTGSTYADALAVVIEGKEVVLLPASAPGVRIIDDWQAIGQELTGSGTVEFDGAEVTGVPQYALSVTAAGYTGEGSVEGHTSWISGAAANGIFADPPQVRHHGAFAQALHAAIDLGLFEGAVAAAYELAGLPKDDGEIDPGLASLLGEIDIQLFAAQAAFEKLQSSLNLSANNAQQTALDITRAKLVIQDAALDSVAKLFEVAGSAGYAGTKALDRRWRDLRVHSLHDKRRNKIRLLGQAVGVGEPLPLDGKLGG